MKLLILGGSGFVSRYVVREAMEQGYEVYYITRGNREPVPGAHPVIADRNSADALREALRPLGRFAAAVDCICFTPEQARLDIALLPEFTDRVVVVSTDSLYHPDHKRVPQTEDPAVYMEDDSYGGQKRKMERVFLEESPATLRWTLFRPPHMFGAGSELGCFPTHTRQKDLLSYLRNSNPIRLVGGGEYLIQPLYAGDLAKAMVASIANHKAENQIFGIAGPDVIQNREYFQILGEILGIPVTFEDMKYEDYNKDDAYLYFCQRVYDLSKLRDAGLPVPSTHLRDGLREQVEWLIAQGR